MFLPMPSCTMRSVIKIMDIRPHIPIKPMLLLKSDTPMESDEYIHQVKFDGFRCLFSYVRGQGVKLFSRHGTDCTLAFPEMQIDLPLDSVILDAEMIVIQNGMPCFDSVMKRFKASRQAQIQSLAKSLPSNLAVFDVIFLNGRQLHRLPLEERLAMLQELPLTEPLFLCPQHDDGQQLFLSMKQLGWEGICSKNRKGLWIPDTRSRSTWYKVKNYMVETVSIGGLRKDSFGWLLLKDGNYVGTMEFVPPAAKREMRAKARGSQYKDSGNWTYLEPRIECKVKFQCYSSNGLMRSPSFIEFI